MLQARITLEICRKQNLGLGLMLLSLPELLCNIVSFLLTWMIPVGKCRSKNLLPAVMQCTHPWLFFWGLPADLMPFCGASCASGMLLQQMTGPGWTTALC